MCEWTRTLLATVWVGLIIAVLTKIDTYTAHGNKWRGVLSLMLVLVSKSENRSEPNEIRLSVRWVYQPAP